MFNPRVFDSLIVFSSVIRIGIDKRFSDHSYLIYTCYMYIMYTDVADLKDCKSKHFARLLSNTKRLSVRPWIFRISDTGLTQKVTEEAP